MKILKTIILTLIVVVSFSFKDQNLVNDKGNRTTSENSYDINEIYKECLTIYYIPGATDHQKQMARDWVERNYKIHFRELIQKVGDAEKWLFYNGNTLGGENGDNEDDGGLLNPFSGQDYIIKVNFSCEENIDHYGQLIAVPAPF